VTESDWEYVEHVQPGGASGGGHASGGALSLLFHRDLGPILVASMTEYRLVEITNQQTHRDYPYMTLTPRIECTAGEAVYTSLSDLGAALTATNGPEQITFDARGQLQTDAHQPAPNGGVNYHLIYRLTKPAVEIMASANAAAPAPVRFILPVVSQHDEAVEFADSKTVRIAKKGGRLVVRTDAPHVFDAESTERTFNLVPGFECLPLVITLQPGKEMWIKLSSESPR
jgi:hypothetical protein